MRILALPLLSCLVLSAQERLYQASPEVRATILALETKLWQMHKDGALASDAGRQLFSRHFSAERELLGWEGLEHRASKAQPPSGDEDYRIDSFELKDVTVLQPSPHSALITYLATMTYTEKGKTARDTYADSALWVQEDEGWKQLFHQVTRVRRKP